MRRGIVLAIVLAVLITGLSIGVTLVVISQIGIRERAQAEATASAQETASIINLRISQGLPNDRTTLEPYVVGDQQLSITFPDGRSETLGALPSGILVTGTAEEDGVRVSIVRDTDSTASLLRVSGNIALVSIVVMVIALVISLRRSRRLVGMLDDLSADAARLGSGDLRRARRYGLPELDRIADSLDASSRRVLTLLEHERNLVSDVTHQLRTPLTAIGLRLEEADDAIARGDTAAAHVETQAAREQLDRLTQVVHDLLESRRDQMRNGALPLALAEVLEQQVDEWTPLFARTGRLLVVDGSDPAILVRGVAGPIAQVVSVVLENALVHGGGTVRLKVDAQAELVRIEVSDEGPGIDPAVGERVFDRAVSGGGGTGLGLSVARALIEHFDGRLELVALRPATFALLLPRAVEEGPDQERGAAGPEGAGSDASSGSVSAASAVSGNTHLR